MRIFLTFLLIGCSGEPFTNSPKEDKFNPPAPTIAAGGTLMPVATGGNLPMVPAGGAPMMQTGGAPTMPAGGSLVMNTAGAPTSRECLLDWKMHNHSCFDHCLTIEGCSTNIDCYQKNNCKPGNCNGLCNAFGNESMISKEAYSCFCE